MHSHSKFWQVSFFLVVIDKLILKFMWKCKEPKVSITILEEIKNKVGRVTPSDFKTYSETVEIKTVCVVMRVDIWSRVQHVWPTTCFCTASELRIGFTFFKGSFKKKNVQQRSYVEMFQSIYNRTTLKSQK